MILRKIKFTKDYKSVDSVGREYKKDKKGKSKVVRDKKGDPVIKTTYKVLYKKGDIITVDAGLADNICNNLKIADMVETYLTTRLKLPVDLKGRGQEVLDLGIDAIREKEKPAPESNKKDKGPEKNK